MKEPDLRWAKIFLELRNLSKSALLGCGVTMNLLCERISCGELLIIICNDDHLPTMRRCKQWMGEHDDFHALYRESLNDRLDIFEEQVIQIADDASRDFKEVARNGRTNESPRWRRHRSCEAAR